MLLCGETEEIRHDRPMDAAALPLLCRLINEGHFFLSA